MVFKHLVKHNGKYYPAGTDVPVGGKPVEDKKDDFSQYMNQPEIEEESTEAKYTKTEINRMSTAELKSLAIKNGIDGADEMTGAELKKVLIEHFKLQELKVWTNQ